MEDAGQFDGDVASTDDNGTLRQLFEVEEPVRVEAEIVTRDLLRQSRSSADSDDETVRGVLPFLVCPAVGLRFRVSRNDRDRVLVFELGVSGNVFDIVFFDVYNGTASVGFMGCRGSQDSAHSAHRFRSGVQCTCRAYA